MIVACSENGVKLGFAGLILCQFRYIQTSYMMAKAGWLSTIKIRKYNNGQAIIHIA